MRKTPITSIDNVAAPAIPKSPVRIRRNEWPRISLVTTMPAPTAIASTPAAHRRIRFLREIVSRVTLTICRRTALRRRASIGSADNSLSTRLWLNSLMADSVLDEDQAQCPLGVVQTGLDRA